MKRDERGEGGDVGGVNVEERGKTRHENISKKWGKRRRN